MSDKTFFEQQREMLLGEISVAMESVLANINKLNRSLEGVLAVGKDFESVEQLWSQFDNVTEKPMETEEASHGSDTEQRSNDG